MRRVSSVLRRLVAAGISLAVLGVQARPLDELDAAAPTARPSVSGPSVSLHQVAQRSSIGAHLASTERSKEQRVAAAPPIRLAIPAIGVTVGFGAPVRSEHSAAGWRIIPPEDTQRDLDLAYRWGESKYSVLPGRPSAGTTFVYGHACNRVQCVFNKLHLLRRGDVIRMTTSNGVLEYTVTKVLKLDKTPNGVGNSRELYSYGVPNQLRLVTCGYLANGTSPFNWAVLASLPVTRNVVAQPTRAIGQAPLAPGYVAPPRSLTASPHTAVDGTVRTHNLLYLLLILLTALLASAALVIRQGRRSAWAWFAPRHAANEGNESMNNRPAHAHDSGEDADWLMDPSGQSVFRTVRHGWDPGEVERALLDLRAERDALVIERDEARLEAAHRTHETPEAAVPDQAALVGEHVATVLRAAEAAAEQLREEAEKRAQAIVRDAEQTSLTLLDDAAARTAGAQAEADQLVNRARLQAEENVGAMLIDFDRLKETTQDLHRQLQQAREAAFSVPAAQIPVAQIPESDPSEPTTELAAVQPADEAAQPPTEETADQVEADQVKADQVKADQSG